MSNYKPFENEMTLEEAIEEFDFFNEGDYITRKMEKAKDIVLKELQEVKSELYEANNRINDLLDTIKLKEEQAEYIENEYGRTIEQKDKIIDDMAIRIFDLQEWIKKQVDYTCFTQYKTVEDIKRIFEERCK